MKTNSLFPLCLWIVVILAGACGVRAQDAKPTPKYFVPPAAHQLMPPGAISLQWRRLETGAEPVWLHLYCVPKGRSPELANILDKVPTGPITREQISTGPSLKDSPFWLDVFRPDSLSAGKPGAGASWKRLNSVPFIQSKDVQEIVLRWLDPQKRAPVLVLHFGYTHWHEWVVLTFPDGWSRRAYAQTFYWGGEGEYGVVQRFDRRDRQGRLIVEEKEYEGEKVSTHRYRWNGTKWDDASQKYFLIGATVKTRQEAEAMRAKRGWGEVVHSSDYPRLRRGYWLWVPERFRSLPEANRRAGELKKTGITAYVRRAR